MSTDGEMRTLPADPTSVDLDTIDASAVDPVEFANVVRTASDADLASALEAGRELILDEIFNRMSSHFRPDLAEGVELVVDWRVSGRPDGGHDSYQLVIRDGACSAQRGGTEQAAATLEISAADFLRVATGNAIGPALYMAGRIIIEGDVGKAIMVKGFFDIPEPTALSGAG